MRKIWVRCVLFSLVAVLAVAVIVLLRWIDYLSVVDRMRDTTRRIETAIPQAITQRQHWPYLGVRPQSEGEVGSHIVFS
jgi:hypothetical protein